ncbi:methionine--tRNA ligase [Candidatus Shikimatogenerans silvanidophilus]|uniref:methionine--tRNA ligase n=1 Tax=Candidatus Shikimatogenerans silvanidophilus TaxID=2782547 RepID=UPI001BA6ADC5|nr:methionine--tRNA ligase [Candidatus Shikimatogenerans silvanidophilus]
MKKYIITAALPYANGPIHIGHLSGVYIPSDIYSRYLRCIDKNVVFICGSDENGAAISIKAKKENTTPKKIINKYHSIIKKSFLKFGISFDNYSRTSSKIHHKTASNFFKKLLKKDILINEKSKQYYDEYAKQFLADRYIIGTCPFCNNDKSYGDQCEKCGSYLNNKDLKNVKSIISDKKPILKETNNWFIKLYKYNNFIKKWFFSKKWKDNVYGQVKSWIKKGLKKRSITRDLYWGVPVPNEKNKVLYVWFEAPIGYISSTIEWAKKNKKNWKDYWMVDNTELIHFIGKDNIVFHCILFPIMLKAHGNFIIPKKIIANEFMNLENKKISTSKNWAIWINDFIKYFPNNIDSLRYFLIINMPEKKDSNFTWKKFKKHNNNELIAILGNFIYRIMILTKKKFNQKIPKPNLLRKKDYYIIDKIKFFQKEIEKNIKLFKFKNGMKLIIYIAKIGNKYLTEEEPWKKENYLKNIIYTSFQIIGLITHLLYPFLPKTSEKLYKFLNIKKINWKKIKKIKHIIKPGHLIGKPFCLFKKIENKELEKKIKKMNKIKNVNF